MSDTQAREEFEQWMRDTSDEGFQPLGVFENQFRQCWLAAHEAGRKAGLEEALAITQERAKRFHAVEFGRSSGMAQGADSVAYHIGKVLKAVKI